MLLILALVCTVIETARINAARVHFRRALSTALDSTLAGYYAPLWEEYHIFGLDTGSNDYMDKADFLARTVKEYMEYTLDPDRDLDGGSMEKGLDLFGFGKFDISVDDQTGLLDYGGGLFINQAVEYMKYAEITDGLKLLLDKMSMLEQPAEVSYIMEHKQKLEEELVKMDEEILNLMRLFDGLMTSKKGLVLDKSGALKTSDNFIKRICYAEVTMENVGINNTIIFQAQRDKYINPSVAYFSKIISALAQIEQLQKNIEEMGSEIIDMENQLARCQAQLDSLNSKPDKTEADKAAVKSINNTIKALRDAINSLKEQIKKQQEQVKGEAATVSSISDLLDQLTGELLLLYDEAITSIDKILEKRTAAAPLINAYENLLLSRKDSLSAELYEGLEEDLSDLKKYTASDSGSYDFYGMQKILVENKKILEDVRSEVAGGKQYLNNEDYSNAAKSFDAAQASLSGYKIQGLTLDYSSLVYDKENSEVLKKVNEAIAGGLSSLVINPEEISDAFLSAADDLPSVLHALTEDEGDYSEAVEEYFAESEKGEKNFSSERLFGEFSNAGSVQHLLNAGINELAEMLLFREYIGKHFYSYKPKDKSPKDKNPTAINYEQEYLIIGKGADADNLNAIISRIIMIRMIFDFISVISDKSIRNEAKLMAAALVGFTGLPILVKITQILILLIWAFAEALLDTTAIMMGKKPAIYKKKVDTSFADLFMLTREQLNLRASALPETEELSLGYDEYLKIFLLMTNSETLAYRSMDLMQENIRLRYADDEFKLANCLYGFELSASFEIKRRFSSFDFLQDYYNIGYDSYQFGYFAADSY